MTNGKALAALILGIASVVLIWVPFLNLILGILALVFGIMSVKRAGDDSKVKGFGIAGIIMGSIAIVLGVLFSIASIAFFGILDTNSMIPGDATTSSTQSSNQNNAADTNSITPPQNTSKMKIPNTYNITPRHIAKRGFSDRTIFLPPIPNENESTYNNNIISIELVNYKGSSIKINSIASSTTCDDYYFLSAKFVNDTIITSNTEIPNESYFTIEFYCMSTSPVVSSDITLQYTDMRSGVIRNQTGRVSVSKT